MACSVVRIDYLEKYAAGCDITPAAFHVSFQGPRVTEQLLHRVASGDPVAMNDCLDRYGGLVWSIVQGKFGNRSDAEDVVQDVFVDLWRSAERFDPDKASEPTFVAMICRRRCIDSLRRSKRAVETNPIQESTEPLAEPGTSSFEVFDEVSKVRELMQQLRDEERGVIELAISQGLSHSEIASQINLPLGTVKTHARRGMLKLRELWNGLTQVKGGQR